MFGVLEISVCIHESPFKQYQITAGCWTRDFILLLKQWQWLNWTAGTKLLHVRPLNDEMKEWHTSEIRERLLNLGDIHVLCLLRGFIVWVYTGCAYSIVCLVDYIEVQNCFGTCSATWAVLKLILFKKKSFWNI